MPDTSAPHPILQDKPHMIGQVNFNEVCSSAPMTAGSCISVLMHDLTLGHTQGHTSCRACCPVLGPGLSWLHAQVYQALEF